MGHLFGPQKQHLRGKQFADDDDVQQEVLLWEFCLLCKYQRIEIMMPNTTERKNEKAKNDGQRGDIKLLFEPSGD
ncbi:hypothetical protein TNIN_60541 [Trichonephila inaurata madagascariensis]|uniref:Uncharacterized protein n=1 Tax=Trichonephila inaurata madagascariensis TaxID=2747483 RepID=A0A8X6YNM1_9ARAC|nr:hypothetical protein TNIN_60541 [Trichonephila inaurata madagascariensis]